jgi:hypothetical protein
MRREGGRCERRERELPEREREVREVKRERSGSVWEILSSTSRRVLKVENKKLISVKTSLFRELLSCFWRAGASSLHDRSPSVILKKRSYYIIPSPLSPSLTLPHPPSPSPLSLIAPFSSLLLLFASLLALLSLFLLLREIWAFVSSLNPLSLASRVSSKEAWRFSRPRLVRVLEVAFCS